MKLMIASDIHGSFYWCKKMIERFENEGADRLVLLGDVLYHGPRNDLPLEYAPKKVIELLNSYRDKILCVRGNCDTEVDQMVLSFPVLADYAIIPVKDNLIYVTHGHNYNEKNLPPICKGDVLLHGHTHVPKCTKHEDYVYMNPGSVSIPKEESCHSYMILENGEFSWRNIETGEEYLEYSI